MRDFVIKIKRTTWHILHCIKPHVITNEALSHCTNTFLSWFRRPLPNYCWWGWSRLEKKGYVKNLLSLREPPPPYRSPPPPSQAIRKSPTRGRGSRSAHMSPVNLPEEPDPRSPEAVNYNSQYRELVSLVNYQREKLSSQQVDLIKVKIWHGLNNIYCFVF